MMNKAYVTLNNVVGAGGFVMWELKALYPVAESNAPLYVCRNTTGTSGGAIISKNFWPNRNTRYCRNSQYEVPIVSFPTTNLVLYTNGLVFPVAS